MAEIIECTGCYRRCCMGPAGGTFNNEANLTLGIPLPLWKANQGNVVKANYAIQQNQKNADFQKLTLETKVQSAYKTRKAQYDQLLDVKTTDLQNMELVYNGMLTNFRKGNISLIEFTDFMDSYRETALQIYDMKMKSCSPQNSLIN